MKKKITVIDDETDLRNLLKVMLQAAGYTVEVFASGEDFAAVGQHDSDLYIIDIDLGRMTGIEVCKHLKAAGVSGRVVLISADPEIRSLAETACADGSVSKPFSQRELLEKVSAMMHEH